MAYVAACPTLEELHLSGTDVSDVGLAKLKRLSRLRELAVADTKVSAAGIADLRRSLPGLIIK